MNTSPGTRLIKNSVLNLFNTFFMFSTSWIISIWVARQLGPANYGIFNLVLWITGIFSWVVGMGLIHAVTKFVAEHHEKKNENITGAIVGFVFKLELILSAVTTVILCFFVTPIADFFFTPKESFFFLLAFLGIVPGVVTAIFSATIEGIQKFEYFTIAGLIITPLSFGAKLIALWLGYGIYGILTVMLIFSFVNVLFYYIVLRKEGIIIKGEKLLPALRHRIFKYNGSVMAILLCDKIVWDKSENFFLGRFCTAEQVGFYNLGFNLAQKIMQFLPQTFWRVLFPAMSSYFGSGEGKKSKRLFFIATRYLAFFAFPAGVIGAILAYPLILHLYGREFLGAQRVLQIIFLSSILSSLANPAAAILYGYEKQSFIYKYGIVLAVINLVINFFVIKEYGALGAAACYGIITILASIGGLIYTCRTMKLDYPFVSVVKIMFSTIITGIVMVLIIQRSHDVWAYILALIAGLSAYSICSLIMGTFEAEDYILLENIKLILPGRSKKIVTVFINFVSQFKTSGSKPL